MKDKVFITLIVSIIIYIFVFTIIFIKVSTNVREMEKELIIEDVMLNSKMSEIESRLNAVEWEE